MSSSPWSAQDSNPLQDMRDAAVRHHKRYLEGPKVSKTIAIVSGGLDSTTLIYHLLAQASGSNENLHNMLELISFDYGQRHRKELTFARVAAKQLGLRHDVVDITSITKFISNSALTNVMHSMCTIDSHDGCGGKPEIEVPDGHYAEETMKATVVPNRNMIMLSIAAGIAVNRGASSIATAVHAGDHFIYPDCRPEFIKHAAHAIFTGNEGFHNFGEVLFGEFGPIQVPFINWSKADIAYRALELGVPLHMTWSCYKGGDNHCGRCGTCVERLEAISRAVKRANVRYGHTHTASEVDKTVYDDNEFWRHAVKEKA